MPKDFARLEQILTDVVPHVADLHAEALEGRVSVTGWQRERVGRTSYLDDSAGSQTRTTVCDALRHLEAERASRRLL